MREIVEEKERKRREREREGRKERRGDEEKYRWIELGREK
jgi:hypothetical protein